MTKSSQSASQLQHPTLLMQLSLFDPPPKPEPTPKEYIRKPFHTNDIRQVRELYIKQNLPGKEVAEVMGRTYGSFKLFLNRNPELQKRKK